MVLECNPGIRDCCSFGREKPLDSCAFYDDEMKPPQSLLWVLILAFFTTALMAFGIGANDAGEGNLCGHLSGTEDFWAHCVDSACSTDNHARAAKSKPEADA